MLRSYPFFALLFFALCPVKSFAIDCTKATTNAEKAICDDADLKSVDTAISNTYFRLLKPIDDRALRDALINSQRVWIGTREQIFDHRIQQNDKLKTRLMHFMSNRRDELGTPDKSPLLNDLRSALDFARGMTGGAYAGAEPECFDLPENYGKGKWCGGSKTYQNNDLLCRSVTEWASGHETEYRTVGRVVNGRAEIVAVCSIGYASTDQLCPGEFDHKDAPNLGWKIPAKSGDDAEAFKKYGNVHKPTKFDPDDLGILNTKWLKKCLTERDYPNNEPHHP